MSLISADITGCKNSNVINHESVELTEEASKAIAKLELEIIGNNRTEILRKIRAIKSDETSYSVTVNRVDPYTLISNDVASKVPDSKLFEGLTPQEIRSLVKKPIMTTAYNSKAQPKKVFGEDTAELEAFYSSLHSLFPGAMEVMEALNTLWDNKALRQEWDTPDGFKVSIPVLETVHGTLEAGGLEFGYTYHANQPSTNGTSIVANRIHSLDSFIPRYISKHADFDFVHIHDDFKAHPNNMGKVQNLVKEAFIEIAEWNPMEKWLGHKLDLDFTEIIEGIRKSSYIVC